MSRDNLRHRSRGRILAAWAVHLLTASGALWALLALDALWRGDWRQVLFWLFVALIIDGVDGTLARAVRVSDHASRVDGASLDLIVDYLNYVRAKPCRHRSAADYDGIDCLLDRFGIDGNSSIVSPASR